MTLCTLSTVQKHCYVLSFSPHKNCENLCRWIYIPWLKDWLPLYMQYHYYVVIVNCNMQWKHCLIVTFAISAGDFYSCGRFETHFQIFYFNLMYNFIKPYHMIKWLQNTVKFNFLINKRYFFFQVFNLQHLIHCHDCWKTFWNAYEIQQHSFIIISKLLETL